MTAVYIILAGLILTLPAGAGVVVFWGTPMLIPVLAGFAFAFLPFAMAAIFHKEFSGLLREARH